VLECCAEGAARRGERGGVAARGLAQLRKDAERDAYDVDGEVLVGAEARLEGVVAAVEESVRRAWRAWRGAESLATDLGDGDGVRELATQVLWMASRTHCGALAWDAFRAVVPPDCVDGDTVLLVPRSEARAEPIAISVSCGPFFSPAVAEQWRQLCADARGADQAGCDEGVRVTVEVRSESRAVSQRRLDSGAVDSAADHAVLVRARVVQNFAFPILVPPLRDPRSHLLLRRALSGVPIAPTPARAASYDMRHDPLRPQAVPTHVGSVIHLTFSAP
jgi:hypothetical protein